MGVAYAVLAVYRRYELIDERVRSRPFFPHLGF